MLRAYNFLTIKIIIALRPNTEVVVIFTTLNAWNLIDLVLFCNKSCFWCVDPYPKEREAAHRRNVNLQNGDYGGIMFAQTCQLLVRKRVPL